MCSSHITPTGNLRGGVIRPFLILIIMYTTYILYSQRINKFYTGQTQGIVRRLEEHNRGKTSFMASGMPWMIMYSKEFNSRKEAVNLELLIKKRGAARFLDDNNIQIG